MTEDSQGSMEQGAWSEEQRTAKPNDEKPENRYRKSEVSETRRTDDGRRTTAKPDDR